MHLCGVKGGSVSSKSVGREEECAVIQCGGRECVSDAEWRGKVWAVKQCGWRLHTCT